MQYTSNRNLKRAGQRFLLLDPHTNKEHALGASHVQEVLSFDRLLRDYKHNTTREPTNYDLIARVFNDDRLCSQKLARLTRTSTNSPAVMVQGPSPIIDTRDFAPHHTLLPPRVSATTLLRSSPRIAPELPCRTRSGSYSRAGRRRHAI
jgi:hypothetical protein